MLLVSNGREEHSLSTFANARDVYSQGEQALDHLAKRADSIAGVQYATAGSLTEMQTAVRKTDMDLLEWATQTATASRRVALSATRLAAAAAELIPDTSVTTDLAVDAEVLSVNAVSIGRSVDQVLSDATMNETAVFLATPAAKELDKMEAQETSFRDKAQSTSNAATRRALLAHAESVRRRRARVMNTLGQTVKTIPVRQHLTFFVAQQVLLAAHVSTEAAAFAKYPKLRGWQYYERVALGEVPSSVVRTLAISGAVALLVLACAVPAMKLFRRYGVVGTTQINKFEPWSLAPLAAAAVPLLATPLIVASIASGTPYRGYTGEEGSGRNTSVTNAPTVSYVDARTMGAPPDPNLALTSAIEHFTLAETETRNAMVINQKKIDARIVMIDSDLVDAQSIAAEALASTSRAIVTMNNHFDYTARTQSRLIGLNITAAESVATALKALGVETSRVADETKALRVPLATQMAASWIDECMRLREAGRWAPMRGFSWLVGSRGSTQVIDAIPELTGGRALTLADEVCTSRHDLSGLPLRQ